MYPFVVISTIVLFLLVVLVRILVVWHEIRRNRERGSCNHGASVEKGSTVIPTLIVLGSGGHTTEILFMTKHLSLNIYRPIHYCKASTDSTSLDRLRTARNTEQGSHILIHDIPRSREVGQSYLSSMFTTLYAFGFALLLVARLRPRLLLCNGPGTCIPLCAAVLWWRVLLGRTCPIVFCESYCRVQTLSLTGKLLYHSGLAELFVVHWKELHEKYPGTVLTTTFISG